MKKFIKNILICYLFLSFINSLYAFTLYSDVIDTQYETAVFVLSKKNIINGFPDGSYRPDDILTRAQMSKILVTALELEHKNGKANDFSDVGNDHWAKDWISIATENELIIGYEDNSFRPDKELSYAESITMLLRCLNLENEMKTKIYPTSYIQKANEAGLLKNVVLIDEKGAGSCSRGYAAIMIKNMLDYKPVATESPETTYATITTPKPTLPPTTKLTTPKITKTATAPTIKPVISAIVSSIPKTTPNVTKAPSVTPYVTVKPSPTPISTSVKPINDNGVINNDYFNITKNGTKETALDTRNGINQAIEYAVQNGIHDLKLEKGTYLLDIPYASSKEDQSSEVFSFIKMRSNIELDLNGSTIKLVPNSLRGYHIIAFIKISNATVKNGKLEGERFEHTYVEGEGTHEYGHALKIVESQNIIAKDLEIYNTTGDGASIKGKTSKNIQILNCDIHDVRRNGISVICVDELVISNNKIHQIYGTPPQKAIDFERNGNTEFYKNVVVSNNKFYDTKSSSITIFDPPENIKIINNEVSSVISGTRKVEPTFEFIPVDELLKKYNIEIYGNKVIDKNMVNENEYPFNATEENVNTLTIKTEEIFVTGVKLNKENIKLVVNGEKESLTAKISPSNASHKNVTWTTSDKKVAKVSSKGVATAVGEGICTITVTTVDGGYTASCEVEVTK